jgi:hypothetical protein
MSFEIPTNLGELTVGALKAKAAAAKVEYDTLYASVNGDTVTDDELEELRGLHAFFSMTIPTEISSRERRAAEFSAIGTQPDGDEGDGDGDAGDEGGEEAPVPAVVASTSTKTTSSATEVHVTLNDILDQRGVPVNTKVERPIYSTLVAAAGVPNHEAGSQFTDMVDVAKAFNDRSAGFASIKGGSGQGEVHYPVAVLRREYPEEFSCNGDDWGDYAVLNHAIDETRLPGGSLINSVLLRQKELQDSGKPDALVAAAGWCAPSETDYDICLQITTDGLLDAPEVQARRGGIRSNTGFEFDSIFGSGTGFFNLTEAQVASGTSKTCLEIPCPSFTDNRLGVTGLCLTGNILANRAYPEATATFTRGALAASAHQINREQISAIATGSTAVDLTGVQPFLSDGSTTSTLLSAVELAIVDIKYRLRLMRSATLEVLLPYWILADMRADWIRRTGMDNDQLALADSAITSAFATRGARVQFLYDWQDAFANVSATGMGADTPVTMFNRLVQFIVYPAGTWVRAVNDVITLNSVYDSTKLATNQVTHLFTETGWAMIRMCPVSRIYTVPVCPSGKTTIAATTTCP